MGWDRMDSISLRYSSQAGSPIPMTAAQKTFRIVRQEVTLALFIDDKIGLFPEEGLDSGQGPVHICAQAVSGPEEVYYPVFHYKIAPLIHDPRIKPQVLKHPFFAMVSVMEDYHRLSAAKLRYLGKRVR